MIQELGGLDWLARRGREDVTVPQLQRASQDHQLRPMARRLNFKWRFETLQTTTSVSSSSCSSFLWFGRLCLSECTIR